MQCAYCRKALPEENYDKVIIAKGILGDEQPCCVQCCKKQKLTIVRLEGPEDGSRY